jgi:hypothetical protein
MRTLIAIQRQNTGRLPYADLRLKISLMAVCQL